MEKEELYNDRLNSFLEKIEGKPFVYFEGFTTLTEPAKFICNKCGSIETIVPKRLISTIPQCNGCREVRNEVIATLRSQNKSFEEIGKKYNLSPSTVRDICLEKGVRIGNQYEQLGYEARLKNVCDKYLKNKTWKYVSGFKTVDDCAEFQCVKCGSIKTLNFGSFRHRNYTGNPRCYTCNPVVTRKRKLQGDELVAYKAEIERLHQKNLAIKAERENKKYIEWLDKQASRKQGAFVFCVDCGEVISSGKYCEGCRSFRKKIRDNEKRKARVDAILNKPHDNVTLIELYERDKGICYICKQSCDWEDCDITADGKHKYYKKYPSIDHVIPISKGGTHTWENVRLACRQCNSSKGAKPLGHFCRKTGTLWANDGGGANP